MATFRGGPCDGRDTGANFNAVISCGGTTYVRGAGGDYYPESGSGDPVGIEALGTHAPRGWADLRRSINHVLPTQLARSRKIRRATMHTISRRRRVR